MKFIKIDNKIYQKIKKDFPILKIEGLANFIFKLSEFFKFFDDFEEKNLINFINEIMKWNVKKLLNIFIIYKKITYLNILDK